jgi:hypothetical protein
VNRGNERQLLLGTDDGVATIEQARAAKRARTERVPPSGVSEEAFERALARAYARGSSGRDESTSGVSPGVASLVRNAGNPAAQAAATAVYERIRGERVRALVAELSRHPEASACLARRLCWLLAWQEIALVHALETRGLLTLSKRDRAALQRRLLRGTLVEIVSPTPARERPTQQPRRAGLHQHGGGRARV